MDEKKLLKINLVVSAVSLVILGIASWKAIQAQQKVDELSANPLFAKGAALLGKVGIKL